MNVKWKGIPAKEGWVYLVFETLRACFSMHLAKLNTTKTYTLCCNCSTRPGVDILCPRELKHSPWLIFGHQVVGFTPALFLCAPLVLILVGSIAGAADGLLISLEADAQPHCEMADWPIVWERKWCAHSYAGTFIPLPCKSLWRHSSHSQKTDLWLDAVLRWISCRWWALWTW